MRDKFVRVALRTSLLYGCFGGLAFVASAFIVNALATDYDKALKLAMYKGCFFVAISTILLYHVLRKQMLQLRTEVDAREQAEHSLRNSEARFRAAFETSAIGMALVALDGRYLRVNRSLCVFLGYSEEELLNKTFKELTCPDDLENDLEHIGRLLRDDIPDYRIEKRYVHRDGYIVWGSLSVAIVRDGRGYPLHFVTQVEDITERKLLDEKVQLALITDELTGLYNRKGFFELSGEQLRSASENGEKRTLFLVKLDDIKLVNDTFGQREGDAIIMSVGQMLRKTFPEGGIIGRIGGVEFAVLVVGTEVTAGSLMARLALNMAEFENRDQMECPIFARVGSAQYRPGRESSLEELIAQADETMLRERREAACM